MEKRKLNYIFHDPNPVEVTAENVLKVMIEANVAKVDRAIEEMTSQSVKEERE